MIPQEIYGDKLGEVKAEILNLVPAMKPCLEIVALMQSASFVHCTQACEELTNQHFS